MHKEFKRNPIYSFILLLPAVLFAHTAFLQFQMGSPVAFLTMTASLLFFINFIWSISTPFVSVDDNKILFKEAIFKQKELSISSIQKIEFPKSKVVKLTKNNGLYEKIRLTILKDSDLDIFKNILFEVTKQNQ